MLIISLLYTLVCIAHTDIHDPVISQTPVSLCLD